MSFLFLPCRRTSEMQFRSPEPWVFGICGLTPSQFFRHRIGYVLTNTDHGCIRCDSLCIIQDSSNDWAIESSKMDGIYANAVITIAATKSTAATEGFLQPRTTRDHAIAIPYMPKDWPKEAADGLLWIVPFEGHYLESDHDRFIEDSKWNTRGWTLQERILSKRVLHFTQNMLYYECRCVDWVEDNRPVFAAHNRIPWLGSASGGYFYDSNQPITVDDAYYSWFLITELYSKRNLTQPSDRLPALSGVAHEVGRLTGGEYYAGIWKYNLSSQLMWNTVEASTKPTKVYRAPSWSWVSVDGWIHMSVEVFSPKKSIVSIEVVEIKTTPSTEDDMGQVTSGHLVLNAPIREVHSIRQDAPPSTEHLTHTVWGHDGRFVAFGRLDNPEATSEPNLFAMLIHTARGHRAGLLLQKLDGKVDTEVEYPNLPTLRRIGTFSIYATRNSGFDHIGNLAFFDGVPKERICLV